MSEKSQNTSEERIVLKIVEESESHQSESTSTFFDELWKAEESESECENEISNGHPNNEKLTEKQKIINEDIEEMADSSENANNNDELNAKNVKTENNDKRNIDNIKNDDLEKNNGK